MWSLPIQPFLRTEDLRSLAFLLLYYGLDRKLIPRYKCSQCSRLLTLKSNHIAQTWNHLLTALLRLWLILATANLCRDVSNRVHTSAVAQMILEAWFPLFMYKNLKSVIPGRSLPKRILLGYFAGPLRQKTIICWLNRGSVISQRLLYIKVQEWQGETTCMFIHSSLFFKSCYPAKVVDVENLYNSRF